MTVLLRLLLLSPVDRHLSLSTRPSFSLEDLIFHAPGGIPCLSFQPRFRSMGLTHFVYGPFSFHLFNLLSPLAPSAPLSTREADIRRFLSLIRMWRRAWNQKSQEKLASCNIKSRWLHSSGKYKDSRYHDLLSAKAEMFLQNLEGNIQGYYVALLVPK